MWGYHHFQHCVSSSARGRAKQLTISSSRRHLPKAIPNRGFHWQEICGSQRMERVPCDTNDFLISFIYSYPNTALCGASEAGYIADYLVGIHDDLPERIDSVLRDGSPLIKIDFV